MDSRPPRSQSLCPAHFGDYKKGRRQAFAQVRDEDWILRFGHWNAGQLEEPGVSTLCPSPHAWMQTTAQTGATRQPSHAPSWGALTEFSTVGANDMAVAVVNRWSRRRLTSGGASEAFSRKNCKDGPVTPAGAIHIDAKQQLKYVIVSH